MNWRAIAASASCCTKTGFRCATPFAALANCSGLDPLHIANEGQFVAVLAPEFAELALDALQRTPGGEDAAIIGEVRDAPAATVLGIAPYGGTRVIDMLVGDPLPRIC